MVRSGHLLGLDKRIRPGKKESKSFKRKLEKKEKFLSKIRDVVSLSAKRTISKKKKLRSRQKKLKAYDLSALSELLPELDAPKQPSTANSLKLNCKNRQKLVQQEGARLRLVLNNPSFQIDPLSAIHQHLQRTQPAPAINDTKEKGTERTRKKKKRVKMPSSSSQMEL